MTKLELIDTLYSGNAWKVRLLCGYLDIPLKRHTVSIVDGDLDAETFKMINPFRQVPVLHTREGAWLAESIAILWYLAKGTSFLPEQRDLQADTLKWLSFEQTLHMANLAQPRLWVHLRKTMSVDDPRVEAWREQGYAAIQIMEQHLVGPDYFGGATPTISDVALFPYTEMAAEGGYDLDPYPRTRAWLERMRGLPGFKPLIEERIEK